MDKVLDCHLHQACGCVISVAARNLGSIIHDTPENDESGLSHR